MDIITRKCLHPELTLHQIDTASKKVTVIDRTRFFDMIDYWKVLLVEKHQAGPGKTCLVWFSDIDAYYFSALFAAIELGMTIIVDFPHCFSREDLYRHKVTMHGIIDIVIVDEALHQDQDWFWDTVMHYRQCKHVVYKKDFDTYQIQDADLWNKVKTQIYCDAHTTLVQYPSSGTTDTPKMNRFDHRTVKAFADQFVLHGNFQNHHGSMHNMNIHHGIGLAYHLLPSFMACRDQYILPYSRTPDFDLVDEMVQKYQINHLYLVTGDVLLGWAKASSAIKHELKATTLFEITPEVLELCKKKNIPRIQTFFGATNVGSPIFLKEVSPDTDAENYDPHNFGQPVPGLFEVQLRDNLLWVCIPSLQQEWRTTEDYWEIKDGDWIFKGRGNQYRINETWILLRELDELVSISSNHSAFAAIDTKYQKLYLAVFGQVDIESLQQQIASKYPKVQVDYVIQAEPKQRFWNNRKIDRDAIVFYARSKLNLKGVIQNG